MSPKRPKRAAPVPGAPSSCSSLRKLTWRLNHHENMWRFYRMEVWPDLLAGALLMRQWADRTEGRRQLDPHPDAGAALNALVALARAKRRRGYVDRLG